MKTIFNSDNHIWLTPSPLSAAVCFWLTTLPPSLGDGILRGWPLTRSKQLLSKTATMSPLIALPYILHPAICHPWKQFLYTQPKYEPIIHPLVTPNMARRIAIELSLNLTTTDTRYWNKTRHQKSKLNVWLNSVSLLKCVWPFCGVGPSRVNLYFVSYHEEELKEFFASFT